MINDISPEIVKIRKLLNQLEMLNANPAITGKQQITNTVEEIKMVVIQLEIITANYAD
jgi:hypothetical protein